MRIKQKLNSKPVRVITVLLVVLAGVLSRFWAASLGYNFDFDSWKIVGDISASGGNVYAETSRYNYGPVWAAILGALYGLTNLVGGSEELYRNLIVVFLTIVDIGIFAVLFYKLRLRYAALFLLNPISVLITGYHNQFDNLAVLVGLVGVILWQKQQQRYQLLGLAVLGISLSVKHILFVLPLWLALQSRSWTMRLLALTVPTAIFLISFTPFVLEGGQGIVRNVFRYESLSNAPLWNAVLSESFVDMLPLKLVFVGALAVIGFALRKRDAFSLILLYLVAVVSLSPAVANQYLTIPVAGISAAPNLFFGIYTLLSTLYIGASQNGLDNVWFQMNIPPELVSEEPGSTAYMPLTLALAAGFIWMAWGAHIKSLAKSVAKLALTARSK